MIDFEEELKNFIPSKEVDKENLPVDTEQLTDVTDIVMQLLKEQQ